MLGIGLDVVLHFITQGTSRVIQHPQTPQGVLHHVAHDPAGRKQLSCRTDGVRRLLGLRFKECILDLGIVELIHPAQRLDVFPCAPLDSFDQSTQNALFTTIQKPRRKKQRIGRTHAPKNSGKALSKFIHLSHQNETEQRLVISRSDKIKHAVAL